MGVPAPGSTFKKGFDLLEGTHTWLMKSHCDIAAQLVLCPTQSISFMLKATFEKSMHATLIYPKRGEFALDRGHWTFDVPFRQINVRKVVDKPYLEDHYYAVEDLSKFEGLLVPRGFQLSQHYEITIELTFECTASFKGGHMKAWKSTKLIKVDVTYWVDTSGLRSGTRLLQRAADEVGSASNALELAKAAFRTKKGR